MGKIRQTLLASGLAAIVGLTGCSVQVRDGPYRSGYYGGMIQHTHGACRHTHLINTSAHHHPDLYCTNPLTHSWGFYGNFFWFDKNYHNHKKPPINRHPGHHDNRYQGHPGWYNNRNPRHDGGRHRGIPDQRRPHDDRQPPSEYHKGSLKREPPYIRDNGRLIKKDKKLKQHKP